MKVLLIKNVSRDPQYAPRRRANPLYVTKAPSILGNRLFPRVVQRVEFSELSESDKIDINNLIKAGVVTVSAVNGEANIQKLSLTEVQKPEPELIEEDEDTLDLPEEADSVEESEEEEESAEPELPEEPVSVIEEVVEEIVEKDEEESSDYTESELVKMKNSELRELLSVLDPDFASAGVKKSILVDQILEKQ